MGVYTQYFQKSKVFLYPLLDIKKGATYVPRQTYIAWEDMYSIEDTMFLCVYQTPMNERFQRFIDRFILSHELFDKYIQLEDKKHLFIFNLKSRKFDFDNFIEGKYSKISLDSKIKILDFFGSNDKVENYIHSFLSPKDHHEEYAEYLGVDIESIKEVYELCTPPDIEKETLINNNWILTKVLEENSIYLTDI
jgi:hypothetical protein